MAINQDKLNSLLGKIVGDFGGAMSSVLVTIGDRLGLYKAMAKAGEKGVTPADLARDTNTNERYVREWLLNQAAGGYCEYRPAEGRFVLTEEQAFALADDSSPANMVGGFLVSNSMVKDEDKLMEAFRSGKGVDWGSHHHDLFHGTDRFFAANYRGNLVGNWIPSMDGAESRLKSGAVVADIGCGHGSSTILMAQAYPKSRFIGFDTHGPSVEFANRAAKSAGVSDRCSFAIDSATTVKPQEGGFDLACCFDCLHDMGDPVGAARNIRKTLKPDGFWMIVEPFANDKVEENLNPVGRVYSAASTMICVAHSLSQNGPALGAQAGEARLRAVVSEGGFTRFRRATQTPFNLVLEARP
ncbi:MAG: methyltransferase domain-containing protein [Phycisphaeraceae bacterium]|nr:methyltransferase domain-containing protein [Phycisphaeraceae bacterium]